MGLTMTGTVENVELFIEPGLWDLSNLQDVLS